MIARISFASALVLAALWSLTLNFVLPALLSAREGLPILAHVRWDVWWLVYLALAWQIMKPGPATWLFAAIVCWLEIAITGTRLVLFVHSPGGSVWTSHLAWHRMAVLLLFIALVSWLYRSRAGRDL